MGWTSPALPMLKSQGQELSASQSGWIGSLFCVGAALATPVAGVLADRWGRKRTAVAVALPFVISWTLIAASYEPMALYVARLSAGIF
jgi:MFS family permease